MQSLFPGQIPHGIRHRMEREARAKAAAEAEAEQAEAGTKVAKEEVIVGMEVD